MVLVVVHGGRGVGVVGGVGGDSRSLEKWLETTMEVGRKSHSSRRTTTQVDRRGVFDEFLRPLLTQFIQSISWVL